jgi:predicted nucleic acid-binding protein
VLSELMREKPDVSVVHCMDRQPQSSIWITSITLVEIGYGLQSLPAGRRSARLMRELVRIVRHCCGPASCQLAGRTQAARTAHRIQGYHDRGYRNVPARDPGDTEYRSLSGFGLQRRESLEPLVENW